MLFLRKNTNSHNILTVLMAALVLTSQSFAVVPAIEKRTSDRIDSFLHSPKPSNIPFIEFSKEFTPQKNNLINKLNLSKYKGLQIYAGYGIYDEDNKYCKYVEKPGLFPRTTPADNINNFYSDSQLFQGRSYATSLEPMSYFSCQTDAEHFGGHVASPVDTSENSFISKVLGINEGWIGLERNDCASPYYTSEGTEQIFNAWSLKNATECEPTKNNVFLTRFGTWVKSNSSSMKKCVIEIDSPFIERPIKVCAPWWSIEREYAKDFSLFLNTSISADHFTQIDIPETMSICTKYEEPLLITEDQVYRDVACTTYYETSKSFACTKDPLQPQCFTDECEGYIRNACTKSKEITPFKDYTKVKALRDGELVWVKDKVRIRTNIFSCPPAPPSTSTCSEKSQVIVFPKECPGSDCAIQSECLLGASSKEDRIECKISKPCEKIFPSPDLIRVSDYDSDGDISKLRGKCSDGTELLFEVNLQKTNKRHCLEYEEYNITKETTRHCVVERDYHDEEVQVKVSESDPFSEDPDCIRLNSVADSRPIEDQKLVYTSNGYADLNILKSERSDKNNTYVSSKLVSIPIDPYIASPKEGSVFNTDSLELDRLPFLLPDDMSECTEFKEVWFEWLYTELQKGEIIDSKEFKKRTKKTPHSLFYRAFMANSSISCGGGTIVNSICYFPLKNLDVGVSTALNNFRWIKNSPTIETPEYLSKGQVSKDECKRLVKCSGGKYNNSWNALTKKCQFKLLPLPEDPIPTVKDQDISSCSPEKHSGAITEEINSQKFMYAITDSVPGEWGYYSNHTTRLYKSNNVSFGDISVFPIKEPSKIVDSLRYFGKVIQDSIRTKKSNLLAGAVSGGVAGGAAASNAAILSSIGSTGVGLIVVGVVVVVSLLFARKKKLNEQWSYWEIIKFVKSDRLVLNKYDFRKIIGNTSTKKCKIFTISGKKVCKIVYANFGTKKDDKENMSFTGSLKPSQFTDMLSDWKKNKEQLFTCYGWSKETTPLLEQEKRITVSYPNCRWYQFNCNKRKSSGEKTLNKPNFTKNMSNYYIGGTNTVSIVVPLSGNYEVKAFDKNDRILASTIVSSDSFIPEAAGTAAHSQVLFGLTMKLAKGISPGTFSKACRYDSMVEWGGGISGIYFENNSTGLYQGCSKSNDRYVKSSSAVKLSIRSLNEDGEFIFNLDKPMPFANRLFLTTLNMEEIRKYRCYNDFSGCSEGDFTNE